MNTTKDGIEVVPGQLWQDQDFRMKNRIRQVHEVKDGKARMKHPTLPQMPMTWVSIRRMHKHSTGWVLVADLTNANKNAMI